MLLLCLEKNKQQKINRKRFEILMKHVLNDLCVQNCICICCIAMSSCAKTVFVFSSIRTQTEYHIPRVTKIPSCGDRSFIVVVVLLLLIDNTCVRSGLPVPVFLPESLNTPDSVHQTRAVLLHPGTLRPPQTRSIDSVLSRTTGS